MPIKAGWRDASLMLWDFCRSNKHCIHPLYNKNSLFLLLRFSNARVSEAVVRNCSVKKGFLKILQNSELFPLAQEFPVNFARF